VKKIKQVAVPVPLIQGASFLPWVKALLSLVPEEHQDAAEISFRAEETYGDWEPVAVVSYSRPETTEESIARAVLQQDRELKERSRELAELERLQAKYGVHK